MAIDLAANNLVTKTIRVNRRESVNNIKGLVLMLRLFHFSSFVRSLAEKWRVFQGIRGRTRGRARLDAVEALESRELLTTFLVTTLNDVVDSGDGVTSLREAVNGANLNPGADAIQFAPNINGTIALSQGELLISDSVTLTGNGSANTIINAQQASRVFNLTNTAGDVVFDSLTITGGKTTGFGQPYSGGGILSRATGTVGILNSQVTGNSTSGDGVPYQAASGGAIFASSASALIITNSTISGNSTTGEAASGGAIYGANVAILTITNSNITGNSTSGLNAKGGNIFWRDGTVTVNASNVTHGTTLGKFGTGGSLSSQNASIVIENFSTVGSSSTAGDNAPGGGVYSKNGTVMVSHSTMSNNSTTGSYSYGGGIYSATQSVTITNSLISQNFTVGNSSGGGGISTRTGTVSLLNSTISGNSTTGSSSSGGGISTGYSGTTVSINSSTITGNSTSGLYSYGGGVRTPSGSLTVVNSTVSGNSTTSGGGGLSVLGASLSLTNTTVVFNSNSGSAFPGGGISASTGTVTLNNSIVAKNTNSVAPDLSSGSDTLIVNNSLIGTNLGTGLAASATPDAQGNLIGTNAALIDPLLGPLANNGGSTQTHALSGSSPAINRGSNALATSAGITTLDQADQPRFAGGIVDMGAYEFQSTSASFATAELSVNENAGTIQVTVNLSAASSSPVTIPFTVEGTANTPSDFTISASPLVIPAGQTFGTIQVNVVDAIGFEPTETIILTFGSLTNATPGEFASTTIQITDVDAPPQVSLSTATQTVNENVGLVTVTVNLSASVGQDVTVPFTVGGTALSSEDFTASASPLVIPAGQTAGTITITVADDAAIEGNETVIVTLGTPTNATLGATTIDTITITDNDTFVPTVSLSVPTQSVIENSGTGTLTVNLSGAADSEVTIPFSVSGTALNGTDYTISGSPLVIAAGLTTGTITLNLVDDSLIEGNETVIVTLGVPTNATLGATTTQTVTITDNDFNTAPSIGGGSGTVTAVRNQNSFLLSNLTIAEPDGPTDLKRVVISYFIPRRTLASDYIFGNASVLGTVVESGPTDFRRSSGIRTLTITLDPETTVAEVESFLRGISFQTKKADPRRRPLGRKIDVRVVDRQDQASNLASTSIQVNRK